MNPIVSHRVFGQLLISVLILSESILTIASFVPPAPSVVVGQQQFNHRQPLPLSLPNNNRISAVQQRPIQQHSKAWVFSAYDTRPLPSPGPLTSGQRFRMLDNGQTTSNEQELSANSLESNVNDMIEIHRDPLAEQVLRQAGNNLQATLDQSYVIDNQRFYEVITSRCMTSTTVTKLHESMAPTFVLMAPEVGETRINATAPAKQIARAGYSPARPTLIFVHGYTQSYPQALWLRKIRALFDETHKTRAYNVLFMDWGLAANGSYFRSAASTQEVGSYLTIFIESLLELGTDRRRIHLIGHSLGAQVSSFAGKRIRPPIGRITALDPAGPCFGGKLFMGAGDDPSQPHDTGTDQVGPVQTYNPHRISPGDALEVDVFHYDDGFLGLGGQLGHHDIYVNGGAGQPGCESNRRAIANAAITVVFGRDRVLSESHTRSTVVPTFPLKWDMCQQVAYECSSYEAFQAGECGQCDEQNSQCFLMTFDWQFIDTDPTIEHPLRRPRTKDGSSQQLFISTHQDGDYCSQHYQIVVHFRAYDGPVKHHSQSMSDRQYGIDSEHGDNDLSIEIPERIALNLTGTDGRKLSLEAQHAPAKSRLTLTHLILVDDTPMHAMNALATWIAPVATSVAATRLHVAMIEINYMSSIVPDKRREISSRLCPLPKLTSDETYYESQRNVRSQILQECH